MKRFIFLLSMAIHSICLAQPEIRPDLEKIYALWRDAIIRKDFGAWERSTAEHRRVEVRNRIVSEKKAFPATLFQLPTAPPSLAQLKFLETKQKGSTAKAAYFGKIDFGVGGEPTNNLLVLSFIQNQGKWLYDKAEFINLTALPEVRAELAKGDLKYLKDVPEAQPDGVIPHTPIAAKPATTIAKAYVFCPGREVKLQINKISRHTFVNDQQAEIIIGGANLGLNEIQYTIRKIEEGSGKEPMTIRVYLFSEVPGTKPIKVFEYLNQGDSVVPNHGKGSFVLDAATLQKLSGK